MFAACGVGYRGEQVCKFAHFSLFGGRRRAYFFRDEMKKKVFFRAEKRHLGVLKHARDSHRISFRSRCHFSHECLSFVSRKVLKNGVFLHFFKNL